MSDCFGSMVKQWAKGQTVDQADWLTRIIQLASRRGEKMRFEHRAAV
jgi:hypothetical protein